MSINGLTFSTANNSGNLTGTINGSTTVGALQGAVGFPASAATFGGQGTIPAGLYTLSASTTEATGTLQTTNWFDLHSQPGAMMEIIQTGYLGTMTLEQTNDGTNIYTVYTDNNPTTAQTLNVPIYLLSQFRFVRAKAIPNASNTGTLAFQLRTFGQDALNLELAGQIPGVVNTGTIILYPSAARITNINTTVDFKVPAGAVGFDVFVNQTALTGTSATYTINRKDPVSGTYGSVAAYSTLASASISSTGVANLSVAAGITATTNVSISANVGTHWGLQTTGTNTSVTQSTSVQFTF